MKTKILILIIILSILSISTVSAGWFDNRVECKEFSMENINGFWEDEDSDLVDSYLWITNGSYGKKEPWAFISIQETNETYPSEIISNGGIISKNYTNNNFISYMFNLTTIAYITLDDKIYMAKLTHYNGTETPVLYDEELFMHDNELLQKAMSTIESK